MRLRDKVAIITGGGQGLGRGMSLQFAREGAKVAIAQRTQAKLEQTEADIRAMGAEVLTLPVDVSQPDQVAQLIDRTVERFGGLDILVNNAGVGTWTPVDEADEAEYDRVMDTNLKGLWMGCHHSVPHLKSRGGGSIINISSVHGIQGGETNSVYAATKGGIIGVTKALAAELAPFRIRVNTISPGAIEVGGALEYCLEQIAPAHHDEFMRRFADRFDATHRYFQPLETIGLPQDVAWCAVYLAADESRFVTGQNIAVDGGVTTYLSGGRLERSRQESREALARELEDWIAAHTRSDADD